jgi:hypothetical protein
MSQRNEPVLNESAPQETANPATIKLKRRLAIQINGSLQGLAQAGAVAGTWKPMEGKHVDMFGLSTHEGTPLDHGAISNALRNAVILKASILSQRSTFPVPVGITMNCVTPQEITDMGERYVCTALPNSVNTNPSVVFETDSTSNDSIEWRNKYPNYNSANLEAYGVMDVQRCPYVFVHCEHPIIDLLRVNKDVLGSDIDEQQLIDKQWYKVSRQVMNSCCATLRNRVLSRVATRDLNAFAVQLHRVGNPEGWDELGDGTEFLQDMPPTLGMSVDQRKSAEAEFLEFSAKKPCSYMATLELEYELQI